MLYDGRLFGDLLAELTASWQELPDKPEEDPESTLRALWLLAASESEASPVIGRMGLPPLDEAAAARVRTLVEQRRSGVPLAYLTGRQCFMGIELLAGPEALIPRKETEILGNAALMRVREIVRDRGSATAIDLCTGSGNLALALAFHEPGCTVLGSDLSADAIALAERNAQHLGLSGRARFVQGDLFEPFERTESLGKVDLVVCNPPYISSAKVDRLHREITGFEPRLAFDGGPFGVTILSRLIREAHRFLKPESWLCFEVGRGQGKAMAQMLGRLPQYQVVLSFTDDQGEIRALSART